MKKARRKGTFFSVYDFEVNMWLDDIGIRTKCPKAMARREARKLVAKDKEYWVDSYGMDSKMCAGLSKIKVVKIKVQMLDE